MEKRVISKTKNNAWNSWADRIGAALTGAAGGYTGSKSANAAEEQSKKTTELMQLMFGGQGAINTQPTQVEMPQPTIQGMQNPYAPQSQGRSWWNI